MAARQAGPGSSGEQEQRGQPELWQVPPWADTRLGTGSGSGLATSHGQSSSPATQQDHPQSPLSHPSWVLAGWTWAGADTEQGTPRGVSGERLQSLLVRLGPGSVSSSHLFFQLFFTVTIDGINFFFLCIFFILDSSTSVFQRGEKKIPVSHEHKSGSNGNFPDTSSTFDLYSLGHPFVRLSWLSCFLRISKAHDSLQFPKLRTEPRCKGFINRWHYLVISKGMLGNFLGNHRL